MSTTVNQIQMPSRHRLRQFFADLMDPEVMIGDGMAAPARSTNVVGVFVTRKLATVALVISDLEAAARLGSAMAGVGPGAVKDAVASRHLTPVMTRNFSTLLDNMAKLFQGEDSPEINLYEMYEPDSVVPSDVAALSGQVGRNRTDLKVGVHGYGIGQMSIIIR